MADVIVADAVDGVTTALGAPSQDDTTRDLDLVPWLPKSGAWTSDATGSTVTRIEAGTGGPETVSAGLGGYEMSPLGRDGGFYFNVGIGVGKRARLTVPNVRGSALGVIFRDTWADGLNAVVPTHCILVDGEPFAFRRPGVSYKWVAQSGTKVDYHRVILARDLPERAKTIELIVSPDTVVNNRLHLLALLVQRSAGYQQPDRLAMPVGPIAVPVAASAAVALPVLPSGVTAVERKLTWFESVVFQNTGPVDGAVSVFSNTVLIDRVTVPAGSTNNPGVTRWRPAESRMPPNGITLQVASGGPSTITATTWGGW